MKKKIKINKEMLLLSKYSISIIGCTIELKNDLERKIPKKSLKKTTKTKRRSDPKNKVSKFPKKNIKDEKNYQEHGQHATHLLQKPLKINNSKNPKKMAPKAQMLRN